MSRKPKQFKLLIPIGKKSKKIFNPHTPNNWFFFDKIGKGFSFYRNQHQNNRKCLTTVNLSLKPASNYLKMKMPKNKREKPNQNKFFITDRNKGKSANFALKELVAYGNSKE